MDRRALHRVIVLAGTVAFVGGITAGFGRILGHPEWAALTAIPVLWLARSAGSGWRAAATILAVPIGWWLAPGEPAGSTAAAILTVTGIVAILLTFILIQERMRQVRIAWEEALRTDDLTGLLNRRGFRERLDAELNRARRSHTTLAVGMLDCDNFKDMNDTFGHLMGDRLLQCAAEVLTRQSRSYDLAARVGGDEFAVAWPAVLPSDADRVARRVYTALHEAVRERQWPTSFSFGVVVVAGATTVDEAVQLADETMYEAKRGGKGRMALRIAVPAPEIASQSDVSKSA